MAACTQFSTNKGYKYTLVGPKDYLYDLRGCKGYTQTLEVILDRSLYISTERLLLIFLVTFIIIEVKESITSSCSC